MEMVAAVELLILIDIDEVSGSHQLYNFGHFLQLKKEIHTQTIKEFYSIKCIKCTHTGKD